MSGSDVSVFVVVIVVLIVIVVFIHRVNDSVDGSNFAHARSVTLAGGGRVCDYDRFNGADWSCSAK